MNIKHLESRDSRIQSQTINGLSVKAFVYADSFTSGDTIYGSQKVDFSKCQIKVILNRDGLDHIIMQDNLKLLGLAGNLNTRGQLAFYADHDHQSLLADGRSLVSFNLPFGGPIKISGDDYIYLEVTNQAGLFAAGYLNSSFLEIKPIKCVGYETFVPQVKSINIQAGTTSEIYSLGDNVIRCALLNYDKTNFKTPIVNNLNFNSDRLSDGFTYFDLINFKEQSFAKTPVNISTEASTVLESDQSFLLVDFGQKFNQLTLNFAFDGDQVTAGNNFLVYWTYKTDWTTLQKAKDLSTKHANAEAASIPSGTK